MMFAEVLLPLPLGSTFTYSIPPELEEGVRPGVRVVVPFGKRKRYTGVVTGITPVHPQGFEPRPLEQLLDGGAPVVRHPQLKFWEWLADYYLCSQGEVSKAALPAGLRLESETFVELDADFDETTAFSLLTEKERIVAYALKHAEKRMTVDEVDRAVGFKGVPAVVSALIEKGVVRVGERLVERYRVQKVSFVEPAFERDNATALQQAFDTVKGAPRQEALLLKLLDMSGFMKKGAKLAAVSRADLLEKAGVSGAILDALVKRGLARVTKQSVSRFSMVEQPTGTLPVLSELQREALGQIHIAWKDKDTVLLHGVTASGKTEVYIHLIDFVLRQGRQVLFLVPEIALTTQLTRRLQRVFGSRVVVYHSKHGDNERVDIWRAMLRSSEPCVVVGARSSVFLPFASLGLVIVDEEHESSFKQQDPAPRYNARDAALMLARMHGAKSLLGSATPAIDTYYKASSGLFALVELTERFDGSPLPSVEIIDLAKARRERTLSGTYSYRLRRLIGDALKSGRQAIVFLNRRGYAPMAVCSQCGYVPKCEHCDVSLTYHKKADSLQCHYCGATYQLPRICPACRNASVEVVGYGTERVEDDIEMFFPETPTLRLDLDTTRNKNSYETIIDRFSQGKASLLVGTQMVTKGLDFANVGVVAVVNADALVNIPDFRSTERAFNMLEQVAGRAGRGSGEGMVAVQTARPGHPVFEYLSRHDYRGFYEHELAERRAYCYPPFSRIIHVYVRHVDSDTAQRIAMDYYTALAGLFGNRVTPPDTPGVSRIKRLHIRRLMIKIEVEASMKKVRDILRNVYADLHAAGRLTGALVHYDVDPS